MVDRVPDDVEQVRGRGLGAHLVLEAAQDQAMEGGEVGGAEGGLRHLRAAEDHVHVLGHVALDGRDHPGVGEELEDGAGLGRERELGVLGLVAPGTQGRRVVRTLDASQEVRLARPAVLHERRLVDDVVTAGHRVEGSVAGLEEPVSERSVMTISVTPSPSARRCSR